MKFSKFYLLVCLFLLTFSVSAQKTWEKPMEKWSKDDAMKILSDSPWAKTYQSTAASSAAAARVSAGEQSDNRLSGGERGSTSRQGGPAPVVIRLHSALPIRQAIVRLQQIEVGYNKFSDEKKKQFDTDTKSFLDCGVCKKFYVVTITKFRDTSQQNVDEGIFQRTKLEEIKEQVKLVNNIDEERPLFQFNPPKGGGDSAAFFFQRQDEKGAMFLKPDTKEFKFVFKNEFLDNRNPYSVYLPRTFDFIVSKLMIGEKLEF